MILEDINTGYEVQDILDEIENQLGFSFVSVSDNSGYFLISGKIKFYIDFDSPQGITMEIRLPEKNIDITDNDSLIELYSSSFESISQIRQVIMDMIGEDVKDDNL